VGAPERREAGLYTEVKALLMRAVAESARTDTKRCWITEVNWPLREGPHSPAGRDVAVDEEAQADYLVRYYLLTLGTGLIERVFWWQVVARGYGLVDPADPANPRRRPSFHVVAGEPPGSLPSPDDLMSLIVFPVNRWPTPKKRMPSASPCVPGTDALTVLLRTATRSPLNQIPVPSARWTVFDSRIESTQFLQTNPLALAAHRHGIPFVVVCPESTRDQGTATGREIETEQRPAAEVTSFAGVLTAPAGTAAFNPAFDVTPAELITAVVTERGVVHGGPSDLAERIVAETTLRAEFPRT